MVFISHKRYQFNLGLRWVLLFCFLFVKSKILTLMCTLMFFYLLNTATLIYDLLHKTPFLKEGKKGTSGGP